MGAGSGVFLMDIMTLATKRVNKNESFGISKQKKVLQFVFQVEIGKPKKSSES